MIVDQNGWVLFQAGPLIFSSVLFLLFFCFCFLFFAAAG